MTEPREPLPPEEDGGQRGGQDARSWGARGVRSNTQVTGGCPADHCCWDPATNKGRCEDKGLPGCDGLSNLIQAPSDWHDISDVGWTPHGLLLALDLVRAVPVITSVQFC